MKEEASLQGSVLTQAQSEAVCLRVLRQKHFFAFDFKIYGDQKCKSFTVILRPKVLLVRDCFWRLTIILHCAYCFGLISLLFSAISSFSLDAISAFIGLVIGPSIVVGLLA